MQSPDSQIIVLRFFEALSRLKTDKVIRGTKSFTDRYDINRRNLHTLSADPTRDIFQPSWLLVGEGNFYTPGWDAESIRTGLTKH